jgi:hypothetical protein
MMYLRQRKEVKAVGVPEDFPAQEENEKLDNKSAAGRWFQVAFVCVFEAVTSQ